MICNLIVDIVYGVLDPRVGGGTFRRRGYVERAEPAPAEAPRPAPVSST